MNYIFLDRAILRNPSLSFKQFDLSNLPKIAANNHFRLALYLASPQFHDVLDTKNYESLSSKELLTLKKYFNRMCFRPTPFGAFSSFTLVPWGTNDLIRLQEKNNHKLHLNFDQQINIQISNDLTAIEAESIGYVINPTLYKISRELRFVKTSYNETDAKVSYNLESYQHNFIIEGLIKFLGNGYKAAKLIIDFMSNISGSDQPTAEDYFHFLVNAQVLVPDIGLNIIGDDYLDRLRSCIELKPLFDRKSFFNIKDQLSALQHPTVKRLKKISEQIKYDAVNAGKQSFRNTFYTGLERGVADGSLNLRHQQSIREALDVLVKLVPETQPSSLEQFISEFKRTYDKGKVPLLKALDPETGIGYGQTTHTDYESDLLKKVKFKEQKPNQDRITWSRNQQFLLQRWLSMASGSNVIELTKVDMAEMADDRTLSTPPSLSVIFRVAQDQIFIESAGGATATALAGRFGFWSEDIRDATRQIAVAEQIANPHVVFADIGHLSDGHTDNINRRPSIYYYEIVTNAVSGLPFERQIPVADLLLSIVNDQVVVLESARLKKIIVPRLPSAYNYNLNDLAVFKFLGDMQFQGIRSNFTLDLEVLFPGMESYPRVIYGNTILSAAKWNLGKNERQRLSAVPFDLALKEFKGLRERLKLPDVIGLSNGDQQLVFNLNKSEEVRFLLDNLKNTKHITLHEVFLPEKGPVYSAPQRPLINQFIALLYQDKQIYQAINKTDKKKRTATKKDYIIGSKWLYLKLYCHPGMANDLLCRVIMPILNHFGADVLKSWFFVRYRDSAYHVRLRIQIEGDILKEILVRLKAKLEGKVKYNLIREYQADTYRREVERYGADIIKFMEDFFYADSALVIHYIKRSTLKSFPYPYHSLAFKSVFYLTNAFFPDINERFSFLETMTDIFYKEFAGDKTLKIDLDQKYRELKQKINQLLNDPRFYRRTNLESYQQNFDTQAQAIVIYANKFSLERKRQLLADMIHMHLNRIFIDRQRNQELIVYYCVYKYSLSLKAIVAK
ncbi:thiopeptide-type bacteriocin biosynthesis protein [Mucilaginibacter sp. UYCu711]|uniref:lantibiotic dehydratase n=1 Tax=Mucilaginibacter sp. UYCu711 TaxID=3156339 RepID=UPI003D25C999